MTRWTVIADTNNPQRGRLIAAGLDLPCALGKGGMVPEADKKEGDGATPQGLYPFRRVFFRADKVRCPDTALPCQKISKDDGWCDAPDDPLYNQPVRLPYGASHEKLWRDDDIYDLILVIGHNDAPPVPGKGSAIFVHVAREGYRPTEGCVAFVRDDLLTLLARIRPGDLFEIR